MIKLSANGLTHVAAILLIAGAPVFAETSSGVASPPLHRVPTPDANTPSGIFPAQMKTAYQFAQIKNFGKGQVIGIVDAYDDPNIESDFGVFNTQFHLAPCTTANGCFTKLYGSGTKPPNDTSGWSNEVAIDVEWAHVIAPQAKIILVEATSNSFTDLLTAVDTAVANGATVVSMSWSGGESSTELTYDAHFTVPNVTFVASSGDGGHAVGYPAASPYVVGVGGTTLTVDSSGNYVSESAWNGSGGGESSIEPEPVYQSGVQTSGARGVPDVSYDGNPSTGVPAYSSWACGSCFTGWQQWGGTSIGAPQWAGLFAIANTERVARGKAVLTQPQFALYPAAETAYHDITTGNNGSCSICKATTGYDFVTGVGSPKANMVVGALISAP